ncbi:hypothetical protein KKKH46_04810 [Helicobacter pylori]
MLPILLRRHLLESFNLFFGILLGVISLKNSLKTDNHENYASSQGFFRFLQTNDPQKF